MKNITSKFIILFALVASVAMLSFSNGDPDPKEIVRKAQEKQRGINSSEATMKMTIIRPNWTRETTMKSWSKGDDYSLILVTAPARDKGSAFLKREKEMWNWQPSIDRVIKMPPSMMSQSWMGSDLTNDDLVQQASTINDYSHKLLGEAAVDGHYCWKIELIPNEGLAIVWGKIIQWISKDEFLIMQSEFYDEDNYLVNTMHGKNVKNLGGKRLPSILEIVPEDEEGHKTVLEYVDIKFETSIDDRFFGVQNMKRVR